MANKNVRRVLVCSAWPYGSGMLHLGNLIGCLLSGDAFTRVFRLLGYETLHVSGTDAHGTKVEYEAARRGLTPAQLASEVHQAIGKVLEQFEIDIDWYTTTESPVHAEFVKNIYRQMEANGYILVREEERAYCQGCGRFLADRFILGTCPRCGYLHAQGNQCDACGALLEPEDLLCPVCAFCRSTAIVVRPTRHWYLDLERLVPQLVAYQASRDFRGNVRLFTERMVKEGLRPRAVTRDIQWGIPAPFAGAEGKVIYVWAEAVLGYISATMEYFQNRGDAEGWRKFWLGDEVWHLYTQGKDNIPFHTVILPAMLLASGQGYHLPDQVAATEYLNWVGGEQFSKTRRVGIYADEALALLPSVYWRFYLFYNRPETKDVEFSWEEFDKAVNGVLVNNIANFVHRVLSYVWNRHGGVVPDFPPDPEVRQAVEAVGRKLEAAAWEGELAPAVRAIADLAGVGNEYFQRKQPWRTGDERAVASAVSLVQGLAVFLEPFVPSFSQGIYGNLGLAAPTLAGVGEGVGGRRLTAQPQPPLAHVDVEDLKRRYQAMKEEGLISLEEFRRVDLRVGRIVAVEEIPGSDKLYKLVIDLGDRRAQAVAGVRPQYKLEELQGKLVAVVANLKPAVIRGIRSECMILAASGGDLAVLSPDRQVEPGAPIR